MGPGSNVPEYLLWANPTLDPQTTQLIDVRGLSGKSGISVSLPGVWS